MESWLDDIARTQALPIADAALNLLCVETGGPYERAQRMAELLRASIRWSAGIALAARLGDPKPPAADPAATLDALEKLRARGALTDGAWRGLARDLLTPWAGAPEQHPLPGLVRLFHDARESARLDSLLGFRNTMAHEPPSTADEVSTLVEKHLPALAEWIQKLAATLKPYRLVVPLAVTDSMTLQRAHLLMGSSPVRGRWRPTELAPGVVMPSGEPLLVDGDGRPVLVLQPAMRVVRPSAHLAEEVFFLDGRGRRGSARYLSLPNGSEREEPHVWELVADRVGTKAREDAAKAELPEEPFRGLDSFDADHARLFFGRERETQELADLIRREALVTLTGPSGVGKTSLLRAGVGPALERRHAQLAAIDAESPGIPGHRTPSRIPPKYAWVVLRPGSSPLASLASAIRSQLDESVPDATASSAAWIEYLLGWAHAQRRIVALAIDQAEELITQGAPRSECDKFAEIITGLGASPEHPARIVISVRGDYFARLAEIEPLHRRYEGHVYTLSVPKREHLVRALTEPLALYGSQFEPGLVDTIVDETGATAGALPLVQFTAAQLWKRRDERGMLTRQAYAELGGVEGALSKYADSLLDEQLTPTKRETAEKVFLALITAEGTRAVSSIEELSSRLGRDDLAEVLEVLTRARLLTTRSGPNNERLYEVVHERLAESWTRLAGLRRTHVADAVRRDQLREAAKVWSTHSRSRDLLWRGDALAAHRSWAEQTSVGITKDEATFIAASEAAERRSRRNQWFLLGSGALLLCVASVLIAFIGQRATTDVSETMARHMLVSQMKSISDDVAFALDQSEPVFATMRSLADTAMPSPDALSRMHDAVLARPGIATATIVFPIGVSWATFKDPTTNELRLRELAVSETGTKSDEYAARGGTLTLVSTSVGRNDPRLSAAYKTAIDAKKRVWLPPAVLSSGTPGIAVVEPLYDASGEVVAVLELEFDVQSLSEYIRKPPLAGARNVLFTEDGTILAYPMQLPDAIVREKRLAHVGDYNDPALEALFAAMGRSHDGTRFLHFQSKDGAYFAAIATLSTMRAGTSNDSFVWYMATIVPDSALYASTNRLKRQSLQTSGIVVVGVLAIAGLFFWSVARSRRKRSRT